MISSDDAITILDKNLKYKKQQLEESEILNKTLFDKVGELEDKANELEDAVSRANSRASSWKRAAEEPKNEFIEAKKKLKKEFNFYRNWFDAHKKKIKELEKDISDKREKIDDLRESLSEFNDKINQLKSTIKNLRSDNKSLKSDKEDLERSLYFATKERKEYRSKFFKSEVNEQRLQRKLNSINVIHNVEIKDIKNAHKEEVEELNSKILRLEGDKEDLEIRLEGAEFDYEEIIRLKEDVRGLQETNYQLEKRLESQNTPTYEIIHPIPEDYGVNYSFGIGQNLENLDLFEDHWDLCQEIEQGIRGLSDTELLSIIYKPLVGLIKI